MTKGGIETGRAVEFDRAEADFRISSTDLRYDSDKVEMSTKTKQALGKTISYFNIST